MPRPFDTLSRRFSGERGLRTIITLAVLFFLLINAFAVLVALSWHADLVKAHDKQIQQQLDSSSWPPNSVGALTADLVNAGRLSAAPIVGNRTLLCFLALVHAFDDSDFDRKSLPFPQLVQQLGGAQFLADVVLPTRCSRSQFWRNLIVNEKERPPRPTGSVIQAAVNRISSFYPASIEQRDPPSPLPADFKVGGHNGAAVFHHIGFGIPRSSIIHDDEKQLQHRQQKKKLFDFCPLIPGRHPHEHGTADGGYLLSTIHDEWILRALYEKSYFAWTHNRGGWDSLRTYEIMSAGAIPVFVDLPAAPEFSVPHLPKKLLRRALALPGLEESVRPVSGSVSKIREDDCCVFREGPDHVNFKRPGFIDRRRFDDEKYWALRSELLEVARRELTTRQVAAKLLRTMGLPTSRRRGLKVLLVSDFGFDYATLSLLHGLADLAARDGGGDFFAERLVFVGKDLERALLIDKKKEDSTAFVPESTADAEQQRQAAFNSWYGQGFGFVGRRPSNAAAVRFITQPNARWPKDDTDFGDLCDFDLAVYTFIAARPHVTRPTMYAFLPELQKCDNGNGRRRPKLAFVDGTDTDTVPAADVAAVAEAFRATVFVRELTEKHV